MTKDNTVKLSIRTKLFVLVLIAFTTLIVATSWQVGRQANDVASESIRQSLKQAKLALQTKVDSRYTSIREVATGIAKDSRVLPLVYDGESLTLQDLSHEFKRVLEFDVLFFTDAQGAILARSDRPEAIGRSMAGKSPLFDKALAGENSRGVIVSKGKLLQIVVIPIFDNVAADVVRGTVALGYEFSMEMAEEIHALTASDIGFFAFSRGSDRKINGASSTYNTNQQLSQKLDKYFAASAEHWSALYQSEEDISDLKLTIEDEEFYSVVYALSNEGGRPLGFVMALRSRTELLKPFIEIQRMVIIIGFACLLGASIFAWIFSMRISRPIIKLVSVTKDIQEGNYPEAANTSQSNDEVGVLYRAVIQMGDNLREKAELENYLAQMSDELDIAESIPLAVGQGTFDSPPMDAQSPEEKDGSADEDATVVSISTGNNDGEAYVHVDNIIDQRYKLIRHIGAGAVGTVFLALDLELDENVAIKIIPKTFFSQQDSINFKEEIRLARQITHRNILRTFDFGSWQDFYYITMEYLAGYDLGALLKNKGAFDTHIGIVMARQICSAMHAAHEQGIIHRDLKPSNMMINRQGILKIMDFGLAMKVNKHKDKDGAQAIENTGSTTIAGTPRYMAPEQFYNWALDERTDIYSIGIILYAIFNGAPPFNAAKIEDLAELHLKAQPEEIKTQKGRLPEPLQKIVFTALAKKPEMRYQSVRAILDDLNSLS